VVVNGIIKMSIQKGVSRRGIFNFPGIQSIQWLHSHTLKEAWENWKFPDVSMTFFTEESTEPCGGSNKTAAEQQVTDNSPQLRLSGKIDEPLKTCFHYSVLLALRSISTAFIPPARWIFLYWGDF
jgi:hypothetical protein